MLCPVEIPSFPSWGRAGSSPAPQDRRRPRWGSSHCMRREKGGFSQSSWSIMFSFILTQLWYTQASFVLQVLLMGCSWYLKIISHLCSQSEDGRSQFASYTAAVALIFQKSSVLSLGMQMQDFFPFCLLGAQQCVVWKGLDRMLHTTSYFTETPKKGSYFQKHVKIGGVQKGKDDKSVAYCTLSVFACWIHLSLLRGTNWRDFSRKQQILGVEWKNSDKTLSWLNYPMHC